MESLKGFLMEKHSFKLENWQYFAKNVIAQKLNKHSKAIWDIMNSNKTFPRKNAQ